MNPANMIGLTVALAALCSSGIATAQETTQEAIPGKRTRIGLGPQLVPSYPGAKSVSIRPLIDVSRARGDETFAFEAADEAAGFPLLRRGKLSLGPSIGFEGSRTASDVGAPLRKVGFTVEAGGFAQYQLATPVRLRADVRKGIGGHRGVIATLGADYIRRDGDRWLFSLGPRVTLADDRYQRAYFGVDAVDAAATGLSRFDAGAGLQAVGATAGMTRQFTPRWGIYGYAKYDRLVGDAARSPIVRGFGSRDQLSGGVAVTYVFGRSRD
jgi:outer membrane protein